MKISLKWSTCILALFWMSTFVIANFYTSHSEILVSSETLVSKEPLSFGFPSRLVIPSLNINTHIEKVGITSTGAMDVPTKPDDVAWFALGPRPGEPGSSVIDGHSGWKDNRPAVFDNLSKLQKGDKVYVEDENGTKTTFVVRELKSYLADEKVPAVFSSSDGISHLNLITCDGVWNPQNKTHSERLVVFTDKEI